MVQLVTLENNEGMFNFKRGIASVIKISCILTIVWMVIDL